MWRTLINEKLRLQQWVRAALNHELRNAVDVLTGMLCGRLAYLPPALSWEVPVGPAEVLLGTAPPMTSDFESKAYPYARPMPKHDPTQGKWGWDYLPPAFADLNWATTRRPRDQAVYLGIRHVADRGFRRERYREPDPQHFVDARECSTVIEPLLARVVGSPTQRHWMSLYSAAEVQLEYFRWTNAVVRSIEFGSALVGFGGLRIDVSTLGSAEEVERHLVAPMAQLAAVLK